MSVFTEVIYQCLCFSVSGLLGEAVLLACMYHFKQPEASTSSSAVSAIFPRQLCCHGECMLFCVVAMGTLYYSLPSALIMFLQDHLYASRTLMLKKKKNISSTRESPKGLPFVETCPGIPDAVSVNGKKYQRKWLSHSDFACLTLRMSDVWEKIRTMPSLFLSH